MNTLDSAMHPWYGHEEFFRHFDFSKYRFKVDWISSRSPIIKDPSYVYLFLDVDSLKTHPNIDLRRKTLENRILTENIEKTSQTTLQEEYLEIRVKSQTEMINICREQKKYDLALYFALQLKSKCPENSYINRLITELLLDIYYLKGKGVPTHIVARQKHTDYLVDIKNFILNITEEEIIELAYHFLNNQSNFDSSSQKHYLLLKRICKETGRKEVNERITARYIREFGNKIVEDEYVIPKF